MNKIAIIGAHGSGKSTLISKIELRHPSQVIVVTDLARVCPQLVGKDSSTSAQKWILKNQIEIEQIFDRKTKPVIFDGCSWSHLAYYQYWGGDIENFKEIAVKNAADFDRVFLLPPNPSFLFDDGLRPTAVEFQSDIYNLQKNILDDWAIKYAIYDPLDPFSLTMFINQDVSFPTESRKNIYCIVRKDEQCLVLHRKKRNPLLQDHSRTLTYGRALLDESQERAAIRLVLEQTGYLVKIEKNEMNFPNLTDICVFNCSITEDSTFTKMSHSDIIGQEWIPEKEFESFYKTMII
jgi:nicotinamide riboside kinase